LSTLRKLEKEFNQNTVFEFFLECLSHEVSLVTKINALGMAYFCAGGICTEVRKKQRDERKRNGGGEGKPKCVPPLSGDKCGCITYILASSLV
jgi:hypothetical protein